MAGLGEKNLLEVFPPKWGGGTIIMHSNDNVNSTTSTNQDLQNTKVPPGKSFYVKHVTMTMGKGDNEITGVHGLEGISKDLLGTKFQVRPQGEDPSLCSI